MRQAKRVAVQKRTKTRQRAPQRRELAAKQAEETAANVPEVHVAPNLPKGAGLPKNQTYYSAEVMDPNEILFAYDEAIRKDDRNRAAFLSRFVTVDEQEVGAFARETKDNAKVEAALPGVEASSKG